MSDLPSRPSLRWQNFHSYEDTGWFELRPITVLIGPNASGKTSLIAPLLLLKQSLNAESPEPLITKGHLLNAGGFTDLVRGRDPQRRFSLHFRFDYVFTDSQDIEPPGTYPPGRCRLVFQAGDDPQNPGLFSYDIYDVINRNLLKRRLLPSGNYSVRNLPSGEQVWGGEGDVDTDLNRQIRRRIKEADPRTFIFNPGSLFSDSIAQMSTDDITTRVAPDNLMYLATSQLITNNLTDFLNSVRYLGPLRERPKRFYELNPEPPTEVGPTGSGAPEIVAREGDGVLRDQVEEWLRHFELGKSLKFKWLEGVGFSLTLGTRAQNVYYNYADSGFGVSQILPLIVQGLHTPSGGTIIAEQPEIHLNPRLQGKLADFFSFLAGEDKYSIIETHSEHLLLRLRTLIASGELSPEEVGLYFVSKADGDSLIERISITEDGHIPSDEWPEGFFEDSLEESLRLAFAQSERPDSE